MKRQLMILIADGSEESRILYRCLLLADRLTDWCVTEAESKEEALSLIRTNRPDAVLLNRMLEDDIVTTLIELKAHSPHLAVVAVEDNDNEVFAANVIKNGAEDYLVKSLITTRSLEITLNSAVSNAALQLKIAQQYEALERYKDVLIHDIQAPLQSILTFSGLISQAAQERKFSSMCGFQQALQQSAKSVYNLINGICQYNRLEKAKVLFNSVSMNRVVQNVLGNLSVLISETRSEITVDQRLPEITCNEPQIEQLLQNLITNAINAGGGKGVGIYIGYRKHEGNWIFFVKDTTHRLDEVSSGQIFNLFNEGSEHKAWFNGTKMAACKKIIEHHHGEIWYESSLSSGTAIFFSIPVLLLVSFIGSEQLRINGVPSE